MSFQTPLTIKRTIAYLHERKYLLPAIQREFVWDNEQIERLFDSLMQGYPIGSFLFWKVDRKNNKQFQFYEFIREYHERDRRRNMPADVKGDDEITAILDGQQRLTALYIGLKGSYASKLPRLRWSNDRAFPKCKLYLNLIATADSSELKYDFRFLTQKDSQYKSSDFYWFEVGRILDMEKLSDITKYTNQLDMEDALREMATETLSQLFDVVHNQKIINHYLEEDESLDKVLNIFIRVNSGGTILSYSDLLLSIATAKWRGQDQSAREIITNFVDELNGSDSKFNFNKDLVLKSCLFLNDIRDIAFKIDNFQKQNMQIIEENWDKVAEALRVTVNLVSNFGYSRETLTSNNALIPIAYYIMKIGNPSGFLKDNNYSEDRKKIQTWLVRALLKRVFSGASDSFLIAFRRVIAKSDNGFPLTQITETFKGTNRSITFNDEEIQHLFSYEYGKSYTFSALKLLYPSLDFKNIFHQDHIFPKSFFKKKKLLQHGIDDGSIDYHLEQFNKMANLQLLEGSVNQEKSDKDFNVWLLEQYPDSIERKDYMKKHYIPQDINLSLENFEEFIEKRTELITQKFYEILE